MNSRSKWVQIILTLLIFASSIFGAFANPQPVQAAGGSPIVITPDSGNWNYPGSFTFKNVSDAEITIKWFLDCWDWEGSLCSDSSGEITLTPGQSASKGLGHICQHWQLDISWEGGSWGGIAEPENCVEPTPDPTPTPLPTPSPTPVPTLEPEVDDTEPVAAAAAPVVCVGDILTTDYRLDTDSESDILIRWIDRLTMKPACQKDITRALGPGEYTHPSVSPDGRNVVFSVLKEGYDFPVLWTAKVDGSNAVPLTLQDGVEIPGIMPDWGKDPNLGEAIAFVDPDFKVQVFYLDTKSFQSFGSGEYPDWASDGQIAFHWQSQTFFGAADSSSKNVAKPCYLPRWSPDGNLDCVTSFDYPKVMNLNFQALQAEKVDEAVDIARDYARTPWAALIVVNEGHQLVMKNLTTGQISFASSSLYEEMNPDWWSASVQTKEQPVDQESDALSFAAPLVDKSFTYTVADSTAETSPILVTDGNGNTMQHLFATTEDTPIRIIELVVSPDKSREAYIEGDTLHIRWTFHRTDGFPQEWDTGLEADEVLSWTADWVITVTSNGVIYETDQFATFMRLAKN